MKQLTPEEMQNNFIGYMRQKFQDKEQRKDMLYLMIKEIQLQQMKEQLKEIPFESAKLTLLQELNTIKDKSCTKS